MREFYGTASYYGIGEILRAYSGFSSRLPLPVSVQHGWYLIATRHDAVRSAPENWYWSKNIEKLHRENFPGIKTRSVGSPFLYLLKLLGYKTSYLEERSGSIVFPCHSSDYIRTACDYEAYAVMLDRLPDVYKPVTVCVYHLDQDESTIRPFVDKGFRITTNGNSLYDPDFLYNYVENVKSKRYAFSNEPTSALIYAVAMGLDAYHYGPQIKPVLTADAPESARDDYLRQQEVSDEWQNYFRFPDCDPEQQKAYCAEVLGSDLLLSQKSMYQLLHKLLLNWRYAYTFMRKLAVN